jgi:hypothetical protein
LINACACTKDSELPHSKLGSIVGDNNIGYAKPIQDLSYEFQNLSVDDQIWHVCYRYSDFGSFRVKSRNELNLKI